VVAAAKLLPRVDRTFSNRDTWPADTHHGVSSKQLPPYLNEFVFRFNRRRTPRAALLSLLEALRRSAPWCFASMENSQIQALERTQPILPLRPGVPARITHDYERNGTTSLFVALEVASGKVYERCFSRHTHADFIASRARLRSA